MKRASRVLVAHAYNTSYSGGRDQEDHSSKPALSSNPRATKKKKKKNRTNEDKLYNLETLYPSGVSDLLIAFNRHFTGLALT
jgi:hypothetical protein